MTTSVMAHGSDYGANGGRATLLLDVGADGRVQHVDIEHVEPAVSLSREQATELVGNNVYTPRVVGGKAMPSRIRVPVEVWKESPTQLEPALVTPTSTNATTSTPAPAYPAQALAARQGGFVRLHLLVAIDGSVKEVRIAQSRPAGVFDAVSIEAAKKWKLRPQVRDGKPVEGWMQVPITFEPERPAASQPSGAASGTPIDLRMKLDAGDTHADPRILSRSGEAFVLRMGKNGNDPDALVIEGTATLLPNGNVDVATVIRKDGHRLAAPRLIVRQGVPGSVVVRDEESGQASWRLELVASTDPESYADVAGQLADAR
jgi:TonB family protein